MQRERGRLNKMSDLNPRPAPGKESGRKVLDCCAG